MTIDKGLSFRVEATPHEGIGSKGLSVKVKVRKKQDAGTQYDTILKIKKAGSHDKTIHLVQSEQTMTSFDMLVEKQKPGIKKRGSASFFRNFKPGGCLDPPLDEDKHSYAPKKATPKSSKSSSSLDSKKTCKYKKHGLTCVESKKEEQEHPIGKSSSASVMSLFKDVPASSLNVNSSNTIITYPTHAKRSKVSTTSSKKSIDEKRKKSFSQTTELYFKPKGDEPGARSPSKVSKKNISREGHRSVDSDALPYIQEAAQAQMAFIQNDILTKKISQPVPVSDVKIREDDAIIADFDNNRTNEMVTGRSATLSDSMIKPLHDYTKTSEKADHIAIASAAGLTVAGLTAAGLTAAAIKQPQDEKALIETVNSGADSEKENQTHGEELSLSGDKQLNEENIIKQGSYKHLETLKTDPKSGIPKRDSNIIDKTEYTKDLAQSVSEHPQMLKDFEKPTTPSKEASIKDMKSSSVLSKNDAITSKSQEPGEIPSSANAAKLNEFEQIEKTAITATQSATLFDKMDTAPLFEEVERQHDIEDGKRDYTVLNAGAEEVFTDTANKEMFKEGSRDKIIQTKPTDVESLRQEHDNKLTSILDVPKTERATEKVKDLEPLTSTSVNELINQDGAQNSALPQDKNASVISSAKDINEQIISKLVAGSRLSNQSQIRKIPSSDNKIAPKDSKITSSPRGSNQSPKITPKESKASSQHTAANVFPLHKATSSHSTDHEEKSSFTNSEKRIVDETALATESVMKSTTDAKTADIESQLAFKPENDMLGSKSSTTPLHQAPENNLNSLLDTTTSLLTTPDKALSTFIPQRSYSGDEANKMAKQGSLTISTADEPLSTFVSLRSYSGDEATKMTKEGSLIITTADEAQSTFVPLRSYSGDESTKMAKESSLEGSQTKGIELPYIRTSFDKEVNTESQYKSLEDRVSQELASLDKFIREAESKLESADDHIIVAKSSDIHSRDSKQSVNYKQGSTLLTKFTTDEGGSTETPLFEPVLDTLTSKVGSITSIDRTAQTENVVLNDFTAAAESAKTVLRTGERPSRDSLTSSLAPSIDIDQTDQFLVDIAFQFSRNGAAKQTIIKSVDAESASNQLSRLNNIISHKSNTLNPFEHPIEIPINPKYNVSLKLNPKQKRKTEKKHSRSSFDITSKLSNKVQKHANIESTTRRKGMDINIVLETIYKEQLQPLERNMKNLKAEILLLTQEQAYIQRTIHNLTEKRSSLRANKIKRSLSCLCKRNIPNGLQYPSFTMQ